jgi:hypothetical protein
MKKNRRTETVLVIGLLVSVMTLPARGMAVTQVKDFLTSSEADKIRDAESTSERIRLFLGFASDRLKKFDYELKRPSTDRGRAARLNGLLSAYIACLDDAAELIDLGREKQHDIADAIKLMQSRAKDFLAQLEKLAAGGPELKSYQLTLEDAILGTKEALEEANKAAQEYAPPPVRRRP